MVGIQFKAYSITNELDLNKIAAKCGIPKKYTWEEPLVLQGKVLDEILRTDTDNDQLIMVFSFGSTVFINLSDTEIKKLLDYLKTFKPDIDEKNYNSFSDYFELKQSDDSKLVLTDSYAVVPRMELYYTELAAVIIAKSVAMERIETHLGQILDKLESMIDRLEKGKLRISEKELARTTARVARHEYNSINYIMILDKPDITWTNSNAAEFYEKMSDFFELNDRFDILKSKTDIIDNIIGGISSISHSMRGLFVEWVIVILIIAEVVLMAAELLK